MLDLQAYTEVIYQLVRSVRKSFQRSSSGIRQKYQNSNKQYLRESRTRPKQYIIPLLQLLLTMETLTHLYIYAACSLFNVILHSTGLFLLLRSYKGKHKTVQHLCIINLSLTELVRNILGLLGDIYFLVDIFAEMKKSFQIAGDYMWYVSLSCRRIQSLKSLKRRVFFSSSFSSKILKLLAA